MTLIGYAEQLWWYWDSAQRLARFWGPVVDIPFGLNPVAALGGLIAIIVTTGIAVGAVAILLLSLFTLYLLLTRVFGLEFELAQG